MDHRLHALALAGLIAAGALAAAPAAAQTRSASASVTVGVSVVDGALRLSTDTATLAAGVSTISWTLGNAGGWRFAAGSIDFGDATGAFSCRLFNDGAAISCNRGAGAPKGALPYRIRLSDGGPLALLPQPNVYISLE